MTLLIYYYIQLGYPATGFFKNSCYENWKFSSQKGLAFRCLYFNILAYFRQILLQHSGGCVWPLDYISHKRTRNCISFLHGNFRCETKLWNKNFLLLKLNLDLHTQYLALLNRTFNKIYLSCLEFARQSSMVDIWKCSKKASELKATTSCLLWFKITKLRKCRQYLGQKLYQKRYKHVYVQRVSLVSV